MGVRSTYYLILFRTLLRYQPIMTGNMSRGLYICILDFSKSNYEAGSNV